MRAFLAAAFWPAKRSAAPIDSSFTLSATQRERNAASLARASMWYALGTTQPTAAGGRALR